ncbi:MAG TPA: MBL fold metallo-hydrolase [Blastocatellia bacterium]|nr:MBL fold metallo-hydrolase [Blastocatellia bacterium]
MKPMHQRLLPDVDDKNRDVSRRQMVAALAAAGLAATARNALADAIAPILEQTESANTAPLFRLQRVSSSVYAAIARPVELLNCNAAVVVGPKYVLVVDTHSKPSAAQALINQIRREITDRPVRYAVNTHFHWDHSQGNLAYPDAYGGATDIIASTATREWLSKEGVPRLRDTIAARLKQISELESKVREAKTDQEKARLLGRIGEMKAFVQEMSPAEKHIALPRITFENRLIINNGGLEIHLLFLGRGHTAGDVVVWVPGERVVATGDLMHSVLPYIGDGFPDEWARTLTALEGLDFDHAVPGHGSVQDGKSVAASFRAYLEELNESVMRGVERGASLAELQRALTPDRLRSLSTGGNAERLQRESSTAFGAPPNAPLTTAVAANVLDVFNYYKKREKG